MFHFLRPILLATRYRWSIVGSVLTSLVIGVLWGGSITAVYPLVEVVFNGQTVQSWLEQDISDRNQRIVELNQKVASTDLQLAKVGNETSHAQLLRTREKLQWQIELEERARHLEQRLQPRFEALLPDTPFGTLVLLMAVLIVATAVKGACLVANAVLVARIANKTVLDMRRIFYCSTLRFDQARFDAKGTSNIMTQLTHNVNLVGAGLRSLFGQSIREPIKMFACLAAAAFICWKLLVLSLLVAPLGAFCIHGVSRQMKRAARREMGGMAAVFKTLMQAIEGIKVVRAYNAERRERHRFKRASSSIYRASMRITFFDSLLRPVTELMGILIVAVSMMAGAYLVMNHQTHLFGIQMTHEPLSGSALVAFFGLMAGTSDPARKLSGIYNHLVRAEMASKSLYSQFERQQEVVAIEPKRQLPKHSKELRLDNVCFAYHPPNRILHNLDLQIRFGEKVAFVGVNGCGKSTILSLVQRLYDPTEGRILIDGVDIKHVNPIQLRKQIAVVQQNSYLFHGTIRENILYGRPQATEAEFHHAAKIAQVDRFVQNRNLGYESQVGDGGTLLSGGQRQRIAIARAVLSNPRILILDEATSQLDRATETRFYQSLQQWEGERTVLMITHRQIGIHYSDRVVEMHDGRIVANETTQEFLKRSGGRGLAA